jgi:hypothetical protein
MMYQVTGQISLSEGFDSVRQFTVLCRHFFVDFSVEFGNGSNNNNKNTVMISSATNWCNELASADCDAVSPLYHETWIPCTWLRD